jgi:hypothetical protein
MFLRLIAEAADLLEVRLLVAELLVRGSDQERADGLAGVGGQVVKRARKGVVDAADLRDVTLADPGMTVLVARDNARFRRGCERRWQP